MAQGSSTVDLKTFTNYVGTGTAQPPPGLTPGGHEAKKKRQAMEREAAARELVVLKRRIRVAAYTLGGSDLAKFFYFLDKEGLGYLTREATHPFHLYCLHPSPTTKRGMCAGLHTRVEAGQSDSARRHH